MWGWILSRTRRPKGLHGKGKYSPNVSTLIKYFLACHCSRPMTNDQLCYAEDVMHSNDRRDSYIGGFIWYPCDGGENMTSQERTMPWLSYCGVSSRQTRSGFKACHAVTAINQNVGVKWKAISTNWQRYSWNVKLLMENYKIKWRSCMREHYFFNKHRGGRNRS